MMVTTVTLNPALDYHITLPGQMCIRDRYDTSHGVLFHKK